MSLTEVEQARVHLTFPKDSVFLESQQPAKASVLIKVKPGARLAPKNVLAINHLVASAVEGLSPDAVSVLDMNGNLLGRPKPAGSLDGPEPSEAILDYRHKMEADLLSKVNGTLEPLLGREQVPRGRFGGLRFLGRGAERGGFRSDALGHGRVRSGPKTIPERRAPTASRAPRPACHVPRRGRETDRRRCPRVTENVTYQTTAR